MLSAKTHVTKRPTSVELEEIMFQEFPVLDHGFVRVTDYLGTDESIANAARISYQKGTRPVSEDTGLINYLIRNWHNTPVEQCEIQLHIKMPVFVARQWIRHRTANVNEMSARYSILDKEFYIPKDEHMSAQSTSNKQGREEVSVTAEQAQRIRDLLIRDAHQCYATYEELLNDPESEDYEPSLPSLARELARMNLPVNIYTQWVWKCDLHNLFNFLRLRADGHAQYEIRAYAEVILNEIVARWVPIATEAFRQYRHNNINLSVREQEQMGKLLLKANLDEMPEGWNKREWSEFKAKVARIWNV